MKKKGIKTSEPAHEAMLTLTEAAAMLRSHPNTIRAWVRQGKLRTVEMGLEKVGMFRRRDVEALVGPLQQAGVIVRDDKQAFPVVGIGASAGGLEAVSRFLKDLPTDLGLAYVFISHLEPGQEPMLADLLRKRTAMPVIVVENGMKLERDRIYVGPGAVHVSIVESTFMLQKANGKSDAVPRAIDVFFTALAQEYQNNAIGVLLSGTGADGTEGLHAIRVEGGLAIVQDATAQNQAMPRNAQEAGVVDLVLRPEDIGKELTDIVKQLYPAGKANIPSKHQNELRRILGYLEEKRGVDFSQYKESTIHRRIIRRMVLSKCLKLGDYSTLLRGIPSEVDTLYNDLLINVSSFFRDPEFIKSLTEYVFPAIFQDRTVNEPVRIWVPACAGGEEVISIAITLLEFLGDHAMTTPVQIFATDLNEHTIEKARLGIYKKNALQNVSPARIKHFFTHVDGHFQVIKSIRDLCVFAKHDLLKDPPFSRIDLISCQNVLIYMENAAQGSILKSFHYAMKPTGFLALGKSETAASSADLFLQPEREHKIYTRKNKGSARLNLDVKYTPSPLSMVSGGAPIRTRSAIGPLDLDLDTDKLLLNSYVPASVLVNKDLDIVRFRGSTAPYLAPSTGKASLNLLKMVRDDLALELRALLQKARKEKMPARKSGVPVRMNEGMRDVGLEVVPMGELRDPHYLVLFKEEGLSALAATAPPDGRKWKNVRDARERRIILLEQELRDLREQMRLTAEDAEANNQELQAANEEVVSSNEELQSINEELETSKEELQSINEEFATINEELRSRNDALRESEERLRLATGTGKVGIWDWDIATDHITWSDSLFEIHGVKTEMFDASMKGFAGLVHPEDRERVEQAIERALKVDERYVIEFRAVKPDGQVIWLFTNASVIRATGRPVRMLGATLDITGLKATETALHERTQALELLNGVSDTLIAELDTEKIVQAVTDAGREVTGAAFGAFFYNLVNEHGESYTLYTLSGAPREAFAAFPMPRATELFGPTFRGEGVVRIGDVRKDPRYGKMGPHHGMPKGHLPVRSYLAVPVTSRDGRVLGGLFYGHPEPDRFTQQAEEVLSTLAAQTALALDNADLHKALQRELEHQRLARKALGESEERYRQLLTNLPVAVFTCDVEGRILLYNEAAVTLWGRAPDLAEKVWHGAHKLYATDGTALEPKNSPMARAIRDGISIRGEEVIIERPDGTRRRALVHPEPLLDSAGKVIGGHNVLVDITERTENEHRLDLATKVGKLGIWDWDIVADTITWTDAVYAIHGVKKGAFQPTMDGYQELIHPEDRERVGNAIRATLEQQVPYEIEFRTLNEEGTVNWVYTSGVLLREGDRPARMMGGTMNITERKQAEETLRTSEERFRLLADNMDQLAWMADPDGSTMWFNSRWEEFSGIPLNEIRARSATDLHHPDHYERVTISLREAAAKGENWEATFPLKGRDGQWHWFLSRVMALKDDQGKVYRWFGTSTDITAEREAREKLRESEERSRLLGDSMAQLAWIGDADGTPIWYNKQWELYTGVDMNSATLEQRRQLIHPDHADRIRTSHAQGVAAGVAWEETFPLRGTEGQYNWFLSRSIPVRDEEGTLIRWFGTNTDVTDREADAQAARRLAAIVQSSADAIISKDLNSIITSWNEGATGVFGYTAEEAIGRSVMMLIPADRSQEERTILDRIKRGERIDHYTTVRVRKDGTLIDVSLTVSPIRDNEGRVVGASKIARDISDNKRLLDAMHTANEQLQMVTDNMPVAVARVSRDHRYVWASQGYLDWIGLPVSALEGRPVQEVVGAAAYGVITSYIDRVLEGERVEYEAQLDLPSRGKRWINAIYAPLFGSGSEAEGWIEVITDITRRRELEEALQDADRHKDHFLATLAHELRNPLAPLKSGIQLLELGGDDPELGRTTQAMMARQIDHMVRLVDDLMDLSRISRGKIDLRKEEVDLAVIIATAMETSEPLVRQRAHHFEVHIPAGEWYVNGDADRLTQVISNLLNNAAKYTHPHGRIDLSLERVGDEAVIRVKDNGIGIEVAALPMVFDMFAQVDTASRSMATGGLGIGLNIVKRLVEMHGGSVEGHSEGKGRGSEFVLRLPLMKRTEKSRSTAQERTINAPVDARRVLVVDDNQDAAMSMSMLLKKRGHVVEMALDGEEAVKRAGSFRPQVIFMDIGMPRMNGYEACKAIRELPHGKDITIVALSGWGQEEDRRRSEEAGFDRHLVKPIDGGTLHSVILGTRSRD